MRVCRGILFSVSVLIILHRSSADCHYPDYLQTLGEYPSWFINYPEDTVKIKVKHNVITHKSCKTTGYIKCHEIRRYCEIDYGNDLYLVKEFIRESPWNSNSYRCVKFFKRSASVVQVRQSNLLEERIVSACEDNILLLDQNPMISVEHTDEIQDCPISGGFDFQLYIEGEPGPSCDDVFLPLRVESDCTDREGMNFYFRRRHCLDELIGSEFHEDPVKIRCVGTWHDGDYTYSIVKWDGTPDFWCIRVSYRDDEDIDEMVIYFKGICTSDNTVYDRKATLKHFARHFVQNVCEDEILICRYKDLCSTEHKDSCKLTCSVCTPEMEEQPCALPRAFHGKWNSLRDPSRYAVLISNSTFTQIDITEHETEHVMNLDWQCVQAADEERSFRKRVLKLKFSNGCYPRYMCIDMELPAHSVMRFRTGSELTWPIDSVHQVCEERYFDYKPTVNVSSYIARSAVPWLYYVYDNPHYVSCNLPWYIPRVSVFTMYHSNAQPGVTGCLVAGTGLQNYLLHLSYTFKTIHDVWKVFKTRRYVCLASIRAIGENDLLISKDIEDGTFTCWTFIEHKFRNFIYVFEAKDCGTGTSLELIESNRHKAIAILVISKNSTDCNFINDSNNVKSRRSDKELSNLTVDSGSSTTFKLHWFCLVLLLIHC